MLMQGICDPSLKLLDITVGAFGSCHDARLLRVSKFCTNQLKTETAYIPNGYCLFGDEAYPRCAWLVTPFENEHNRNHTLFNTRFSRVRLSIERTFGKLKKQWPLTTSGRFSLFQTVKIVTAACVLHNITILNPERETEWDDLSVEEGCHVNDYRINELVGSEYAELASNESRDEGVAMRNVILNHLILNNREVHDYYDI
jgi:hypothetical protein